MYACVSVQVGEGFPSAAGALQACVQHLSYRLILPHSHNGTFITAHSH